jgi:hypothetical protein
MPEDNDAGSDATNGIEFVPTLTVFYLIHKKKPKSPIFAEGCQKHPAYASPAAQAIKSGFGASIEPFDGFWSRRHFFAD